MITMLLAVTLQVTVPQMSELRVERISFADAETHEYRVQGGLGLRCTFASVYRLECGHEEFYAEFDKSQFHRALTITPSSIIVTKQQHVTWLMYEAWLGTVMQRHLFPDRTIRFVGKGIAKQIPKSHRDTLSTLPDEQSEEQEE